LAVISAIFGLYQLKLGRTAREDAVKISKAQFLLELDRRWEAESICSARQALARNLEEIKKQIGIDHPMLNDGAKTDRIRSRFAVKLSEMRKANDPDYALLLSLCGFFETAGLMVELDYISLDAIKELFEGPIVDIDLCMREHIDERSKETGVPDGFFAHALSLCDRVKGHKKR
jgi:hypothetical protein